MSVALVVTFATFAAVAGAAGAWSVRLSAAPAPVVIARALLGLAVVFHLTWVAFWVHPTVGRIVALLLVSLALASLGHLRAWRSWRQWAPLTALVGSLALLHHGFAFLWGGVQHTFSMVAIRYECGPPPAGGGCGPMPSDNVLPALFADRLWNNQGTALLLGDWNGSDRPPLQSGAILLGRSVAGVFGVPDTATGLAVPNTLWSFAASSLSQFLVLLAVVALVRALGLSQRAAVLTAAFVALVPLSLFNLLFTWPKMLSAAYGVAAVAVLVAAVRGRSRPLVPLVTAAALATFSMLAHGGGAFALPLYGGLALALLLVQPADRRSQLRDRVVPLVAAVGAVALLTAPWSAYTTWADPGHGRLVKWHLAGLTAADDRPFLTVLRESYAGLSVREVVDARLANLRSLIDPALGTYLDRDAPGWVLAWRLRDFFSPLPALGLGWVLATAFLAFSLLRARRTVRDGPIGPWWAATWVMWLSVASAVCWVGAMFGAGSTVVHTGSYIWLVILAAVPFAFLADTVRWGAVAGVVVIVAQAAYTGSVYWSMAAHSAAAGPIPVPPQVMSTPMLGLMILGLLGVVACVGFEWRSRPTSTVSP